MNVVNVEGVYNICPIKIDSKCYLTAGWLIFPAAIKYHPHPVNGNLRTFSQ